MTKNAIRVNIKRANVLKRRLLEKLCQLLFMVRIGRVRSLMS